MREPGQDLSGAAISELLLCGGLSRATFVFNIFHLGFYHSLEKPLSSDASVRRRVLGVGIPSLGLSFALAIPQGDREETPSGQRCLIPFV